MPRLVQSKALKGSQHWLQYAVNNCQTVLADSLRAQLGLPRTETIRWYSPLANDDYAEYRDEAFLGILGIELRDHTLQSFWPAGGPQWDALGRTSRGDILLLEAKAHLSELTSDCAACPSSLELIQRSLDEAGRFFGSVSTAAWSQTYYQYANRLAHLYLLRQLSGIPAWLIFLYFVNAEDVAGPATARAWRSGIERIHAHLGLTPANLGPNVIDIFLNTDVLVTQERQGDGKSRSARL